MWHSLHALGLSFVLGCNFVTHLLLHMFQQGSTIVKTLALTLVMVQEWQLLLQIIPLQSWVASWVSLAPLAWFTLLVHQHRFPPMIFATEQLGKAINLMASSFRAAKSTQFVYTPSNASSMRDPNFKLELIKVRSCMFAVLGLQSEV